MDAFTLPVLLFLIFTVLFKLIFPHRGLCQDFVPKKWITLFKKSASESFCFYPMYSYSIELKTPKRGQLNVNEKKIVTDFPRRPGSFPLPYVTLIFTCEFFRIYCGSKLCVFFFYLLKHKNWTKYEKYKNPKVKGKLTIKCTFRVDLTLENRLHIKTFSKDC